MNKDSKSGYWFIRGSADLYDTYEKALADATKFTKDNLEATYVVRAIAKVESQEPPIKTTMLSS